MTQSPPIRTPATVALRHFSAFFDTELGKVVLALQHQALEEVIKPLPAYVGMQLAASNQLLAPEVLQDKNVLRVGHGPSAAGDGADQIWAEYDCLPIASDSLDFALIHHVLEFSDNPHRIITEASRTLRHGGHLILLGVNPISLWGVRYLLARLLSPIFTYARGGYISHIKFLSTTRILDWLELLNFDLVEHRTVFHRLPVSSSGLLSRTERMESLLPASWKFGLSYVLVARKRAYPPMLEQKTWQRRKKKVAASYKHIHERH